MPLVGSGLGYVIDLRSSQLSVLSGVAVVGDRGFLNVVRAQQKVGGAGVVQVQEGIVVILAINCEQVRCARESERGKVSKSALRVHRDARRGLSNGAQVIAWIRG